MESYLEMIMQNNEFTVSVYAIEGIKSHEEHITGHGSGYSVLLDMPTTSTTYHWEVHPNGKMSGCSNARESLTELADNLSFNYKAGFGENNPKRKATIILLFVPEVAPNLSEGQRLRMLTPDEQIIFYNVFKQANSIAKENRIKSQPSP
jgi:hypothetical protein